MAETSDLNVELIHEHMLEVDAFVTPAVMGRRLGFNRGTIKAAFLYGLERGWYVTRDHPTFKNPRTGGPSTEYKAVRRT